MREGAAASSDHGGVCASPPSARATPPTGTTPRSPPRASCPTPATPLPPPARPPRGSSPTLHRPGNTPVSVHESKLTSVRNGQRAAKFALGCVDVTESRRWDEEAQPPGPLERQHTT